MKDKNAEFENLANPHSWFLVAEELHSQALTIYRHKGQQLLIQADGNGAVINKKDYINRPIFLLAGFALENMLKAFLIYENPNWISNGTLNKKLRSHSLTRLYDMAKGIPDDDLSRRVLNVFEDGLNSWARYPCGLSIEQERSEKRLDEELWTDYLLLMHAWTEKLCSLLTIGWTGPHEFYGRFEFTGTHGTSL